MSDDLTEDQFKVLALAQSGAKLPVLAEHLNRTEEDVRAELEAVLAQRHPNVAPDMRLELERLDTLTRSSWNKAVAGEPSSIRAALDVSKRRTETLRTMAEDQRKAETKLSPGAKLQRSMDELLRKTLQSGNVSGAGNEVLNTENTEG